MNPVFRSLCQPRYMDADNRDDMGAAAEPMGSGGLCNWHDQILTQFKITADLP